MNDKNTYNGLDFSKLIRFNLPSRIQPNLRNSSKLINCNYSISIYHDPNIVFLFYHTILLHLMNSSKIYGNLKWEQGSCTIQKDV